MPGVTPWFCGNTQPARVGCYQRIFTDGVFHHWWDGECWLGWEGGMAHWRQVGDYPAWRGLSNEVREVLWGPLETFAREVALGAIRSQNLRARALASLAAHEGAKRQRSRSNPVIDGAEAAEPGEQHE